MAAPASQQRALSIIDPEALVLISVLLQHEERRFSDLLEMWAGIGSRLLSVQRMKTLMSDYPPTTNSLIAQFAVLAMESGDRRWRTYASTLKGHPMATRGKEPPPLRLIEGPSLVLRLRAGFGVGTKADLLAFLLGLHGTAASLQAISMATGYTNRAIRSATDDMVLAGLISRIDGHPLTYLAQDRPWAQILDSYKLDAQNDVTPSIPPWRFWAATYAYLAAVIDWAVQSDGKEWSPYVAASRARDLTLKHEAHLKRARIPIPPLSTAKGAEYLQEFSALVRTVTSWVETNI